MDSILEQCFIGLGDSSHIVRVSVRLGVATLLGGLIGYERQSDHQPAGLRTHMLVALGAALFILIPLEVGVSTEGMSHVVQGLMTGIGFLGAGSILQLPTEHRVRGLTTAASIWVTSALGAAVGFGLLWPAFLAVVLGLLILFLLRQVEARIEARRQRP